MNNIAIIPARSGSKGLSDKNIINLKGKPLMTYTIEAALESGCFLNSVYVSTDSLEYAQIARDFGAKVIMRGARESSDQASSFMVIEHALKEIGEQVDTFCLLQPTSPLRTAQHIREAYSQLTSDMDFCVSVTKSDKNSQLIKPVEDGTLANFTGDFKNYARQKYDEYYPNGAIYIARPNAYLSKGDFFGKKSRAYLMDKSASIDIDGASDLIEAISILSQRNSREEQLVKTKRRIEEKLNQVALTGDLLFIGHSVLDMFPNSKIGEYEIVNLGISGACTKDLNNYLIDNLMSTGHIKKLLIMVGINDLKQEYRLEEFRHELLRLLDNIADKFPDIKIYLSLVMHNNGNVFVSNTEIDNFNQVILEEAKKFDAQIYRWNSFYNDYGKVCYCYSKDGVHLTEKGYELFTKEFLSALRGEIDV
ncbi:hypothetical protein AWM75_07805 [Aerococcus urinaehominis]|uniref:Uncharacterized protein n=1 Tax=Aerococcus urinaehominis TaxID=128944 RepID=A0A109RHA3_9LACT|nr:GDSL-type esterase/lipase family protein [Aerococcus urinaehominis]AMB99876.1 hypothetical protein AWM75_07805 [Aerococcus urinaehominis]SDM54617.1 N-acylneuraminate cytidylyltransferase [Aerococcus urinaehominis]